MLGCNGACGLGGAVGCVKTWPGLEISSKRREVGVVRACLLQACFAIVESWLQIRDLNSGTFGFVELALDKTTGQQVAIKFIERGDKVWAPPTCCPRPGLLQEPPPRGLDHNLPAVEGHRCPDPRQQHSRYHRPST